jgi:hypothetical protein
MNDFRRLRKIILAVIRYPISADLRWNRAMTFLLYEFSIGELTTLLCVIILTLIPLTIGAVCDLESRRRGGWIRPGQRSIKPKIN